MKKNDNTGLGLIKATIERAQNETSLFNSALKKLVNSSEEDLKLFLKTESTHKEKQCVLSVLTSTPLKLKALSGKTNIVKAEDVFSRYISFEFKNWGLNQESQSTKKTKGILVYEIIKNATLSQMFGSLNDDLDKLCLTQHQIVQFCQEYPGILRGSRAIFFMFKENGEFFFARVNEGDGLSVRSLRFNDNKVHSDTSSYDEDKGMFYRLVTRQTV